MLMRKKDPQLLMFGAKGPGGPQKLCKNKQITQKYFVININININICPILHDVDDESVFISKYRHKAWVSGVTTLKMTK